MKFLVDREDFYKALLVGSKSLLAKANLPILSNILISAEEKSIDILSTNLETATKVTIEAKVASEGQITLTGRSFVEFISQLSAQEVAFERLGTEALVSAGRFNARFATMPAEEFPAIPKVEKGFALEVDARTLAKAIERVAFSAAQDEGRPILTGVLCDFSKDKVQLVATDGYRLSFDEIGFSSKSNVANFKIVIPARALIEAAKIITEFEEGEDKKDEDGGGASVLVSESLNQIIFKFFERKDKTYGVEFTSRLIEGEFPNWQKIIPSTFATKTKVQKAEFAKLVKVASIFARDSGNIIKLKVSKGENKKGVMSVSSSQSQVGSSDASNDVELSGEGGEIAFNFRYLLEALSVINGDEVFFEMNESLNPGRLSGVGANDPFFHIIMPVRLQT